MVAVVKETVTLFGTAVSCAQCFALITNGLKPVDGIIELLADTQANTLTVGYNPDIIDEDGIRRRLRGLGFGKKELYCIC